MIFLFPSKLKAERVDDMGKWNEEAAPNNNLNPATISTSNLVGPDTNYQYTKDPFAPGKKDQIIKNQKE